MGCLLGCMGLLNGLRMKSRQKAILLFILDVLLNAGVIVVLVFVIRVFIISPFQVHGPSMCDTFNDFDGRCLRGNGEYIMINKFGYQNFFGWQVGLPDRGDVIVFIPPDAEDGEYFIKRVIGLPGETVEFREGYVYVINDENPEGFKLDESTYLNEVNWGNTDLPANSDPSFEVPEGEYLVLGDNRKASSDSRRCFEQEGCTGDNTSTIMLDQIQGKAWVVLWPFGRMRVVDEAVY